MCWNNGNNNLNNSAIISDSQGQLYLASNPYILTSLGNNIQWQQEFELPATSDFAVTADDQICASSLAFGVWKRNSEEIWEDYSLGLPSYDGFIDVSSIDLGLDNILWVTVVPLDQTKDAGIYKSIDPVSDVEEISSSMPKAFNLEQNYPNPFNPSTTINYSVPELSFVTIIVYDVLGNEIEILANEEKPAGNYETEFYVTDLPSGIYFYKLQASSFIETKKMVFMK